MLIDEDIIRREGINERRYSMRTEFDDGYYDGELDDDGYCHGFGTYHWDDGDAYEGYWYHGKFHGKGKMKWSCGDSYNGDWIHDHMHGFGKYEFADGGYYEGAFENDCFNGKGTYIYEDGRKYVGAFKNDQRHGYGELYLSNGNTYKGDWSNDEFHGTGKYTWSDGSYYEGQFENDRFNGRGIRVYTDGGKYIGSFKNDLRHGQGELFLPDGDKYIGNWYNDKTDGVGKYTWADGSYYDGQSKNGQSYGHGVWHDSESGETIEGDWIDDDNAINAVLKVDSTIKKGKLVNGVFVSDVDQWTTNNSSLCAAIHPNNNTVEHGSYHRNDSCTRGALNHIHFTNGNELLIEDLGDKLKVTLRKDGTSQVRYSEKLSENFDYADLALHLFKNP